MSSISEKSIFPSRLLSCLIAFSVFLLISSSMSILEFNDNFFMPKSIFQSTFISQPNTKFEKDEISVSVSPNATSKKEVIIIPTDREVDSVVTNVTTKKEVIIIPTDQEVDSVVTNVTTKKEVIIIPTPQEVDSEVTNVTTKKGEVVIPTQEVDSERLYPENTTKESEKDERKLCDKSQALLKVYMYDLPPEFHFGLLGWQDSSNQTWPSLSDKKTIPHYPGGLNLQHSTEYWLTLDLLASNTDYIVRPCSAIRVQNSNEADVIYVPFFSSLSYNRHSKHHGSQKASVDRILQEKLVKFLKGTKEWKRSGGKDHLILAHHPNSMLIARKKLGSCMFVLADFGRYPVEIANVEKDVIAPYKHMVKTIPEADSPSFDQRPTLVYFQGAIYRKDGGVIRQELYYLLKNEKDVHFTFGSVKSNGINQAGKGMASSKFCLNIAGDTPSSNRLFDAIASHCVPVIISDEIELPYEDVLDYREFCVFIRAKDALKKNYLLNFLRGIKQEEWTKMWKRLKQVSIHYEYQYPSQPNDAVDMIWQTVSRKKTPTQLNVHRKDRYRRSIN